MLLIETKRELEIGIIKIFPSCQFIEKGLDQIIKRTRNKNLFFSTKIEDAISEADMIFISVNTPIKNKGLGAGQTSDLRWVESCARKISLYAKGHTIVVEKSTLPVRTAQTIKIFLFASNDELDEKIKNFFCPYLIRNFLPKVLRF